MFAVHPQPDGAMSSVVIPQRVAGLGALDEERAGHGVHAGEVEPGQLPGGGARTDLAARRVEDLELGALAGTEAAHGRERVVPSQVVLGGVDRVVGTGRHGGASLWVRPAPAGGGGAP